eukprot:7014814-Pyramimonas_sp.AAC.1
MTAAVASMGEPPFVFRRWIPPRLSHPTPPPHFFSKWAITPAIGFELATQSAAVLFARALLCQAARGALAGALLAFAGS